MLTPKICVLTEIDHPSRTNMILTREIIVNLISIIVGFVGLIGPF